MSNPLYSRFDRRIFAWRVNPCSELPSSLCWAQFTPHITSFCGRKCLRHFYTSLNLVVPSINRDLAISLWIIHRLMSYLFLAMSARFTYWIPQQLCSSLFYYYFFRAWGELGLTGFLVSSEPRPISRINGKKVVGYTSCVTDYLCCYYRRDRTSRQTR